MATDSHKRLALAIIDFLSTSMKDGTLSAEDNDSIDIAINCIAESFHVDPADTSATSDALGGQNLLKIYQVYEKLKGRSAPASAPDAKTSTGSSNAIPTASTPSSSDPKPEARGAPTDESERLKGQGNAAMQRKNYDEAISFYTKALEIAPLNTIYLSNRAAAYSAQGKHEFAKNDAELATVTDPRYTKAWSRLGLAKYALGDVKGSMEAYQAGIDAEGNGGSDAMKKGFETAKRRLEEEAGSGAAANAESEINENLAARGPAGVAGGGMPDLSGLASMLGGGGGGGGGAGGMPDLSSIMQNPMMRQMAQNLMSNPDMMNNLMNNPALRGMAERFGGGGAGGAGGMPNLSEMMNDPSIAELARNFMGGMGGAGAGAGRGAGGR